MRFDWYQATVRDDERTVLDVLSAGLGGEVKRAKGMHGYERGYVIEAGGSSVARVLAGGRNGWPNVAASGDDTDAFVPIVRGAWPGEHRVTRMDASEDFDGPGTWARLYGEAIALADDRKLRIDQAGDWHRREFGRTLYLGSRKSAVLARLYEKGKQLKELAIDGGADISADLCRLELQVRPEKLARERAAVAAPEEAWGYADWSKELARRVFALDVERVHIRERREPDLERALHYMVKQYGSKMEQLMKREGTWERALCIIGYWVSGGRELTGDRDSCFRGSRRQCIVEGREF